MSISASVKLVSTGLDAEITNKRRHVSKGISISDDVWLGCNSVVLKGVSIATGSVLGACTLVNKNIKGPAVYGGNPLRTLRPLSGN